MNKYIRKSLAFIVMLAIILVSFSNISFAAVKIINETVQKEAVTSGVTLETYDRFTTSGWIHSNVLRVDLSNENVKVDSIVNQSSVIQTSKVRDLAKESGAVAAVNGCFFDYGTSGKGYAYGPIISSGEVDLASTRSNTDIATFSLDKLNNALFTYWDTKVELITPSGERKVAAAYNRYNGTFNGMQIIDAKWGKYTPGATTKYPDWLEMVVIDGVVTELRQNQPGIEIPVNGYVVMGTGSHVKYLLDNFKLGDPVSYEITMNVDAENMEMALTGGAMLVKDGAVVSSFTHSPTAAGTRAPRTAIGTSADGKTLLVVAVDGRNAGSIGMTQAELAQYMKELGCANAINMDGGGSTTMVARKLGTTGLSTVNTPSDGFERGVTGSLGIFSVGPSGPVDSLVVSAYEDYVFVNSFRAFTARGLDKYLNPVNINPDKIEWSVEGVTGSFKSNVFYPSSAGEGIVTAKLADNVIGKCSITVLSEPVRLEMNIDTLHAAPGSKTTFTLKGWNKDGYSASIPPANIKWSVGGGVGAMSSNVFTAGGKGTGYVSATLGKTTVTCPVSILTPGLSKVIENFEAPGITLQTSAKSVTATYSQAKNVYKSKTFSGKLTYDFTKDLKTNRAAYLNLANGGYILDTNTKKIGVWVYSSTKKPIWIGATVLDAKGNYKSEYFSKGITWTGWKYLEVPLDDINNPKTVTNIFAVQPAGSGKTSGTVYFDNLTMVYDGYPDVDMSKVPKSSIPVDSSYKNRTVSGNDSMSFAVFGQASAYDPAKDKSQTALLQSLAARINKYLQASVVVGQNDNLTSSIKTQSLSTTSGYNSIDYNGSRLIQLNTSKGGLRLSSSDQWFWLKNQLNSFDGNNIFVFTAGDPANFTDKKEAALFKETLSTYQKQSGKNVWVFYNGSNNSSTMENGIKYISTAGLDSPGGAKFVAVKVKGNTITYQFNAFN